MSLPFARAEVVRHLQQLEPLFTDGMQLTFIAHHPDHPERELVVTSVRDLRQLVAVIERRIAAGEDPR